MAADTKSKTGKSKRGNRAKKTEINSLKKPETGKSRMSTRTTKKTEHKLNRSSTTLSNSLEAENLHLRESLEREIRERKLMEETLQRNEAASRELAETALRQTRALTLLGRVRATIASKLDMPALLRSVVESIVEVYGYTHVSIYICEGDDLVLQHQVGYEQAIPHIGLNEGINGRVFRTGQPILIEDVTKHPEFLKTTEKIKSEITVPLMDNDLVAGTLNVESASRLTENDLNILVSLSVDVGVAIGRSRLYEDVQRRNRTLSALQESTLAIMGQLGLPEALQSILTQAAQLINTSHGYIYLVQEDDTLELMTGMGIYTQYVGLNIERGEGLAGRVWQSAQPLIVNDYLNWEGRSKKFEGSPFYAVMGVALLNRSNVVGVLGLSHLTPDRTFDEGDTEVLSRFAQLASIAIDNAALYTQVHQELLDRKQSDERLRASEERLAAVMEGSQLGYSDWNIQTDEVKRNERWAEMLGYTLEEVQENIHQWRELLHPHDRERALRSVEEHLNGKTPVHRDEYRMRAKDGTYRWVLDQGRIIEYNDQGRPLRMTATHTDITERKQAEEALKKSKQRLQAFFDQSLDGFFFCDFEEPVKWKHTSNKDETLEYIISKKRFTEVNNAMLKQYGVSREKFLCLTTKDIFAHDLDQGRKLRRELFDKGHLHLETYERTSEGLPVWFEGDYVCLYDVNESITGFFGIQRDITDRKKAEISLRESEKNLEEAQRIAHVGSWNWVAATDTPFWSKELCAILEVDPNQPAPSVAEQGKFYSADSMERMKSAIAKTMETGEPYDIELEGTRKDGSKRWLLARGERWFNDKGEHIGLRGTALEITERKLAEQALRESEERYRTLFAGMLDGVYRSTHDGKFVDVNPAMVKMFGYSSREEMLKIDIKKDLYFSPEERNSLFLDTGQEKVDEFRMKRKDGTEIWVEDHGRYVHDENGNVIYHEGILRDITERKKAEDALKRSEAFTKSIVENEPECVKIVGMDGILQYMNPAGLAMIEAESMESVLGKSVYPIIAEKDRQAFIELTEKVLQGGQGMLRFEVTGLKGTKRWLDTHAVPLYDEHGRVTALLGITRDITERMRAAEAVREAEEKYRSIFENAVEGIYQSSPEGRFYTVNPAFASMMGYKSPQEMMVSITDIARQLYVETDRRKDFIRQLEEQGSLSDFDYQMRRKDGRLIWVAENARLVRDSDGKVLYYEGMLEDITARKQNEQRIDVQLKQLNALHVIDNAINSNFDLRTTLDVLLREVIAQLRTDAASVLLFNKDTHTLDYTAGRGFISKAIQHTKLNAGEGYAGRVLIDRKIIHIPDLTKTENIRLIDALNLAGDNFVAYVGTPLIAKGQVVGVLEIFQRTPLVPDPDWFEFLSMIADQAAIAIDNTQLFQNLQRSNFDLTLAYDATIEGWSRALDLRDRETEGHTQRVTNLTVKLARKMGIPDTDILHIRRGALLHDIGKMGIPDSILHKPDQLTAKEWEIMHQHTNYAYQMLTPIKYLKPALDIPRYHHEKWDGSGYPDGLKGEQIPIAARIFAVVDVWDALTSDRSYREAWSREKAIEYIRTESGKHFDPKVVEMFLPFILNEAP